MTGLICAFPSRPGKAWIRAQAGPSSESVRPTTLMTAVRCMAQRPSTLEHGNDAFLDLALGALFQLVEGGDDGGRMHLVNFEAAPDAVEQGDGQLSAEM